MECAQYSVSHELPGLELLDASYTHTNFSKHSHEGYTVGLISSGAQKFYRSGGNHVAPTHSIILVNADDVHNGRAATQDGWSYQAMYPLETHFKLISEEIFGPSQSWVPYFDQPVIHDQVLARRLAHMFSTMKSSSNRLERESLLYECLRILIVRHARKRPPQEHTLKCQSQLMIVRDFLQDFPEADVSLSELSTLVGLSSSYLVRAFQKAFGLPPHKFQIQSRIRKAKCLLREGHSIIHTAHTCGFHDQSHFHRHFKQTLGVTPKQYATSVTQ